MAEEPAPWTVEAVVGDLFDGVPPELAFFSLANRLKLTKRQGWLKFGIDAESVAEHSFIMTLMAMTMSLPENINRDKCMKLCLVHDLAESIVGDITPHMKVPKAEKNRREELVFDYIATKWPIIGVSLRELFHEFEAGETEESRIAQDIDKLEMLIQAVEYEKRAPTPHALDLGEFFGSFRKVATPACQAWGKQILEERERYWSGREHLRGEQQSGGVATEAQKLQDEYYGR